MQNRTLPQAERYTRQNRRRRVWHKIVGSLACIVVFVTTYMLILPAITLEQEAACGLEEHTHTEECYTVSKGELACHGETLGLHQHTDACYDQEGSLICGYADYVIHTHDENCYDEAGKLVCTLPEIQLHQHDESCYTEQRELTCTLEEDAGHTHNDACYEQQTVSNCDKKEHTHSETCYQTERVLSCALAEHSHKDICYDEEGILVCDQQEHQHTDSCYTEIKTLICEKEEHTHSELCSHTEQVLVCTQEETDGHTHTDACYETRRILTCGQQTELHTHTSACYDADGNLTCGLLELTAHQHTADCWTVPEDAQPVLICGLEEHTHTSECYPEEESQDVGVMALMLGDETEDSEVMPLDDSTAETKTLPVTSITGSGTTYDAATDTYKSNLRIEFEFRTEQIQSSAIYTYTYTYPKGVIIPDDLLSQKKDLLDNSGQKAGTYTFIKNENGTYSVQVKLDDSYVQNAGETITGYVQFAGELDAGSTKSDGSIELVGSDDVNLEIPANEIEYPSGETNLYDIDVEKSGSYVVDGDKLVYTVYVRSYKGTPDPTISFTDTITADGLTLGAPNVTVEEGYRYYSSENAYFDGSTFVTVDVSPDITTDGTISMSLPGLTRGKDTQNGQELTKIGFYKITYTYDITDMDVTEISPSNKVAVSATDQDRSQTVSDEAETTVNINKNHAMSKSGWYNASTGKIQWTITVNPNGANIAGAELTDEMLETLSNASNISFSPADNSYKVVTDSDGKVTGIKFKAIGDTGVNTNKYTITYSTDVTASWDDQKITNTATFDPTPGEASSGDEITGSANVNVSGGSVAKSMDKAVIAEDGKTAEVTWTVTLTVPESGLPAGTGIVDDVTQNQWGSSNTNQWMTQSQVTDWACNLYWKDANGNTTGGNNTYTVPGTYVTFLASDGKTYTYNQINVNTNNFAERLTFQLFTITLDKDLKPPEGTTQLTFTYSTTVDLKSANIGSNYYYNSVTVGDKKAGAEYVYRKAGVKKTDGNGSTDTTSVSSDGTVTWKVIATMDDQNCKKLTLVDTLPKGVTLESLNLTGWGNLNMDLMVGSDGTISGTDSTNQYIVGGTYSDNTITLEITPQATEGIIQNDSQFTLTVTCKVNGAENQTGSLSLTNRATMKLDDAEIGSSEQTQNWTYKTTTVETQVVDKSGAWDNDNRRLNYSIVLNPEGKDLVEGADTLTLIDELKYTNQVYAWTGIPEYSQKYVSIEVSLVQSSVKLYKAVKNENGIWTEGEEITDWNWVYSSASDQWNASNITNTITATGIPDGTPLILKYSYTVHSDAESGYTINSLGISNTARLEGVNDSEGGCNGNWKWEDQSSSAGVTTDKTFTLYKVEAGNYNKNLEGAVFSVYAYDVSTNQYGETAVKTYTTDSNGMLQIKWANCGYDYNTLYKVVETTPPTGYKLPDTVKEYYFYFSSEMDTDHTLPTDLPATAVDLSKTSHTVYAENVKNTTQITVNKQWFDAEGNEITSTKAGSITFDLYQIASTTSSGGSGGSESGGGTGVSYRYTSNGSTVVESGTLSGIKVGSVVEVTVTMTYDCTYWKPIVTLTGMNAAADGTWTHGSNSVYTCQATITEESVVVDVGDSAEKFSVSITKISDPESGDTDSGDTGDTDDDTSTEPAGTLYGTYTISNTDGWTWSKDDLPLTGTDEDGNTVYYTYYVVEHSGTNYNAAYDNNDGIASGTITIKNTQSDNPTYELPATGGRGTPLYTLGGLLLIAVTAPLLYKPSRRRREGRHPS